MGRLLFALILAWLANGSADAAPRRHPRTACERITVEGIPGWFCPSLPRSR